MTVSRKSVLKAARTAEQHGQNEQALRLYQRAGAAPEAARLLADAGRHAEAAEQIVSYLGVPPEKVGQLDRGKRKLALFAAGQAAKGRKIRLAAQLYRALGKDDLANQLLERAVGAAEAAQAREQGGGDEETARRLEHERKFDAALDLFKRLRKHADAARIAHKLGRMEEAAAHYADAGMAWEASNCYLDADMDAESFEQLLRVPKNSEHYREACNHVVRLLDELGMLNFRIEHFLKDFVEQGPHTPIELELFYRLGHLYMSCDLPECSKEVFRKLVAANPTYRDTVEILGALEVELMSEAMEAFGEVVQQDEAFRGKSGSSPGVPALDEVLPDLPDLPDLPELPQTQGPGAPLQGGGALPSPTISTLAQQAPVPVHHSQAPAQTPTQTPPQIPARPERPEGARETGIPARPERPEGARGTGIPAHTPAPAVPTGIPINPPPTEGAPTPEPYPPSPTVALAPGAEHTGAPQTLGLNGAVPQPGPQPAENPPGGEVVALQPGARIADRYRLEAQLGKGGAASVYRATDLELDEEVALKFMASPRENPADFERFRRELKLTRQLTHPNVIRVHDIGVHQQYSYISMELLIGKSLFELMLGELDLEDGLTYLIQTCAGLQAAHDVGVVHRDVKPGNIFVTEDDVAKVMDFGIARQRHVPGVTVHGRTFGTPEYMAPEQIRSGSEVTTATDLYALGVTLYEVCTGQVPFQHPEAMPLMMMHLEQQPRPPRGLAPGLPESLEQVILQLLEKEPSERISSCNALARRLRQIRQEYRNAQR